MNLEDARRLIQWVGRASVEELGKLVAALTPADVFTLQGWFELWAHQGQLPPGGDRWRVWLMMAGRGFGKTRAGAEWVHSIAASTPGIRIALVGASIGDARSVMVEGVSGLTAVAALRQRRISWEPSLGRVKWPNGSEAQIFSGDHADGLRGPEHDLAWCDELAKWREAEASWDNLQMGLRRGDRPRALVTTTPRPIALIKRIQGDPWTVVTGGRTKDNINLDEAFAKVMQETYGGTRLGRQELDGEMIADVEGALWPRDLIERCRASPLHHPSDGPPPPGKLGEELIGLWSGSTRRRGRGRVRMRAGSWSRDRVRTSCTCWRMRRCAACRR
ncbi:MAG: terminase family protein [Sphingomicrobium sp.]